MLLAWMGLALAAGGVTKPISAHDIQSGYAATIRVQILTVPGHGKFVALDVVPPPNRSVLAAFVRDHQLWYSYMVHNGHGFSLPATDSGKTVEVTPRDSDAVATRLQHEFVRRLMTDSAFNAEVVPAVAGYLRAAGALVDTSVLSRDPQPISIDTAMKTAVRFFYPNILTPTGILTHVCTVINAVREMPRRNLAVEAVAFSAIMEDVTRDSSYIEPDFGPARALMNSLDIRSEPDSIRLNRAQGSMWSSMARSERLRELLLAEAKRDSAIVRFRFVQ